MSVTKRIIDLAKANLNSLLEKASDVVDPRRRLASIPDVELEAELARRRAARIAEEKVAEGKARIDGVGGSSSGGGGGKIPQDREAREQAAREREARVRAAREARERAQQQARPRASAGPRPGTGSSGSRPGSSGGARAGTGGAAPRGRDPQVARYYERLEVPYGSDWDTVRAAYRRLMRKYHPDLHVGKSAEKQKAAHEVSQALTQAYNELEKHLVGGPNRRG